TRDVKPIFAKYCVDCHGPKKQKTGLRLDTAAAVRKGNDGGPVIVPGRAKDSPLLHALLGDKELTKMPPEGRPQPSAAEIDIIKRWIDAGAPAPNDEAASAVVKSDHWSFQPVKRSATPTVRQPDWVRNPIDAFILARLEKDK